MNRYEQQAAQQRNRTLRFSVMLWTAGAAGIIVIFAVLGLSSDAPREFWKRGAIVVAILLLILRQVTRRIKVANPKSAQPDPQSRLNLE